MDFLRENYKRLELFANLDKNWNGYKSNPVKPEIVQVVKDLLPKLDYQPELFPLANGGIQLEWDSVPGKDYLEIEIDNPEMAHVGCYTGFQELEEFDMKISDIKDYANEFCNKCFEEDEE